MRCAAALADADLVVVENLGTIPLNLPASRVVNEVLAGRPAIFHHHDPPWQRERFAHITELPADDPAWAHVTINRLTEREMADRGIEATTIYNGFAPDPPPGDRTGTRRLIDVAPDELLCVHPVRAIERKRIPDALRLTAQLGGTYWLPGGTEEGYEPTLRRVLADAECPVRHIGHPRIEDIYAAGDLVVFPSSWEGFGNPPIEAALHRKPAAVGSYAVADELRQLGFEWFPTDDPEPARAWLDAPDPALLDHNQHVARTQLSTDVMRDRLRSLLDPARVAAVNDADPGRRPTPSWCSGLGCSDSPRRVSESATRCSAWPWCCSSWDSRLGSPAGSSPPSSSAWPSAPSSSPRRSSSATA